MLTNPTIETLKSLKLRGLLEALEEQHRMPSRASLSFEERIGLLIDASGSGARINGVRACCAAHA